MTYEWKRTLKLTRPLYEGKRLDRHELVELRDLLGLQALGVLHPPEASLKAMESKVMASPRYQALAKRYHHEEELSTEEELELAAIRGAHERLALERSDVEEG